MSREPKQMQKEFDRDSTSIFRGRIWEVTFAGYSLCFPYTINAGMETVLNSQLGLKMLSLMVGFVSVRKVSVTRAKS